jgi:hypothetical protein
MTEKEEPKEEQRDMGESYESPKQEESDNIEQNNDEQNNDEQNNNEHIESYEPASPMIKRPRGRPRLTEDERREREHQRYEQRRQQRQERKDQQLKVTTVNMAKPSPAAKPKVIERIVERVIEVPVEKPQNPVETLGEVLRQHNLSQYEKRRQQWATFQLV